MQTGLNWLSARKQFKGQTIANCFLNNKLLFLLFFLFLKIEGGQKWFKDGTPLQQKAILIS